MANKQITVVLQKSGAVFESEIMANGDRFSGRQDLLTQSINANIAMVEDGTFEIAATRVWDQTNFTLTLVKIVTDMLSYDATWGPIAPEVRISEAANGWVQLSETVTDIE